MKFMLLLGALKQMQFWLESGPAPQVMLAAPTMEEFLEQKLPAHCTVTKYKIHGRRVPVRGRGQQRNFPLTSAYWPEDELREWMCPTLVVVINGEPDIRIADYKVHCRPGDFLYIPPHLPKSDGVPSPKELKNSIGDYDVVIFHSFLALPRLSVLLRRYHNGTEKMAHAGERCWMQNPFLSSLFVELGHHLQNGSGSKSVFYLLAGFILLFQEEIENGRCFDSAMFPSDSPLSSYQDPIAHAQQYIQNHLENPLSIDIVARWVGLSRSVFTRRFRATTNQSFNAYLAEQRLEQAKILLSQTDLPIVHISERVGLRPARLHQLFQQKYQDTPRSYRLLQRKVQNDAD